MLTFEKIGSSSNSQVFKMFQDQKPTNHALKMISHNTKTGCHLSECNHLHNEYKLLKKLSHPNIIKVHKLHNDVNKQFCALEMDLASRDFYALMEKLYPKTLKPSFVRSVFKKIASAIHYLHSNEITHNDVKLENIFLIDDFEPILGDFGFARNNKPLNSTEQRMLWRNRSTKYVAPEILNLLKNDQKRDAKMFDEKKTDVFAFGVTLFSALFLRSPYAEEASENDKMFKFVHEGNFQKFWECEELQGCIKYLEAQEDIQMEDLKNLLEICLSVNPDKRMNIEQVLQHKWFTNGKLIDEEYED